MHGTSVSRRGNVLSGVAALICNLEGLVAQFALVGRLPAMHSNAVSILAELQCTINKNIVHEKRAFSAAP